jgi:PII-like signaling protein
MRDEITDLSYRLPTIIFVAGEQEQMIEVVWPN